MFTELVYRIGKRERNRNRIGNKSGSRNKAPSRTELGTELVSRELKGRSYAVLIVLLWLLESFDPIESVRL